MAPPWVQFGAFPFFVVAAALCGATFGARIQSSAPRADAFLDVHGTAQTQTEQDSRGLSESGGGEVEHALNTASQVDDGAAGAEDIGSPQVARLLAELRQAQHEASEALKKVGALEQERDELKARLHSANAPAPKAPTLEPRPSSEGSILEIGQGPTTASAASTTGSGPALPSAAAAAATTTARPGAMTAVQSAKTTAKIGTSTTSPGVECPLFNAPDSRDEYEACVNLLQDRSTPTRSRDGSSTSIWMAATNRNITSAEGLKALLAAFTRNRGESIRENYFQAMGAVTRVAPQLADSDVVKALLDAVDDESELMRRVAVYTLGDLVALRHDLGPELAFKVALAMKIHSRTPDKMEALADVLNIAFVEHVDDVSEETIAALAKAMQDKRRSLFGRYYAPLCAKFSKSFLGLPKVRKLKSLTGDFARWLQQALEQTDDRVAQVDLAVAVRFLGKDAAVAAPVLRRVASTTVHEDVAQMTILALQSTGDTSTETRTALSRLVAAQATPPDVKVAACNALWSMQEAAEPEAAVLADTLDVDTNPSAEVRAAAARALRAAGIGAVRVLERVVAALQDPAWEVLQQAAKIVDRFGREMTRDDAKLAALRLKRIMMDGVPGGLPPAVRVAATLALGALGEDADVVLKDLEQALLTSGLLDIRKAAEVSLKRLASTSPAAAAMWKKVEQSWFQAFNQFRDVVEARDVAKLPELASFDRRVFSTEAFFPKDGNCSGCWPVAGGGPERTANFATEAFSISLNSSAENARASCALLCARATPFVIDEASDSVQDAARFRQLFNSPGHPDWEGALNLDVRRLVGYCVAFTVLDATEERATCLLFQTMPPNSGRANRGDTPIYALKTPSAASFCAKAWEKRTDSNQTLIQLCKDNLAPQVGSKAGTKASAATIRSICEEECEGLLQRVREIEAMPDYMPERRDFALAETSIPTQGTTGTEVALADACTRDVVQLVESRHIKCCAAACGWSYKSRTCEGIAVLRQNAAVMTRWQDECCMAMGVIRGSDRDRMCRSALSQDVDLAARGDSEAVEMGQQVRASLSQDEPPTMGGLAPALLQLGPPNQAFPLSEAGFRQASLQGVETQKAFILDVIDSMGGTVSDLSRMNSFVAGYIANSTGNFQKLVEDLGNITLASDGWIRKEVATAPCRLDCNEEAFLAATLLQCAGQSSREWFATGTRDVCLQVIKEKATASPHKCGEEARNTKEAPVFAAAWQFDEQSFRTLGRPSGTCRLFSSACRPRFPNMLLRAKPTMNSTREVLWSKI